MNTIGFSPRRANDAQFSQRYVLSLAPLAIWLGFVCVTSSLSADTFENFTFTDDGTSITITGYPTSAVGAVDIPATINGKPVVGIREAAFSGCGKLASVTIPPSVTSIGSAAFFHCSGLTSVTIPASVTSIGINAFSTSGIVGTSSALVSISVDDSNPNYSSTAGVLFDKLQTTLIQCPSGMVGSYTIPSSVTIIGDNSFYWCSGLTSVTIPFSVTSIGIGAFSSCARLKSVTIPASVTSIGGNAFGSCFQLTSVTIPASVTSIGDYAFSGCPTLVSISVDDSNPNYSSTAGVIFDKLQTTLIQCPSGMVGSYTIPLSVTSIGIGAFSNCYGLKSVTISPSVTSIGSNAFQQCGLTSVTIPASVTSIGIGAFSFCSSLRIAQFDGNAPKTGSSATSVHRGCMGG